MDTKSADVKYVVNVREPPKAERGQVTAKLAQEFGVDKQKAHGLLKRMPGPVTKMLDEETARETAERFRRAGLDASLERVGGEQAEAPAASKRSGASGRRERSAPAEPPASTESAESAERDVARNTSFEDFTTASPSVPSQPKRERSKRGRSAPPPASTAREARSRSGMSLRNKFLLTSVIPVLLVSGLTIGAILLTIPNALRTQLLESARNPAIAFASSISGLSETQSLDSPGAVAQLQTTLNTSRESFREQEISFILVTDTEGNQLAGWYESATSTEGIPPVLRTAIQSQARRAVARAYIARNDIELGTTNPPSRRIEAEGTAIEVTGQAIDRNDQSIGAVVIGISSAVIDRQINGVLGVTIAIGVIIALIAVVFAVQLIRGLTSGIDYLIRAADQISRGKFDTPVELESNDELGELSRAIERMRFSLQEGIERLRRRRR